MKHITLINNKNKSMKLTISILTYLIAILSLIGILFSPTITFSNFLGFILIETQALLVIIYINK